MAKATRCVLEYLRRSFSPWKYDKKWIWKDLP